jgi:preprotein translocase subunit SecG
MIVQTLVLISHLLLALAIIGLVLLQRGKGAEAGTGFGAGASGTVFGARGSASFFSRATAVLATLFFATSLTLAYFATQSSAPPTLVGSEPGGSEAEAGSGAALEAADEIPVLPTPVTDGPEAAPVDAGSANAASAEGADQ